MGIPIVLDLKLKSFDELGVDSVFNSPLTDTYEYWGDVGGTPTLLFSGSVVSQVFTRSDGSYLYLYQADNGGPSILEKLNVLPFYALDKDNAGVVTGTVPSPFDEGGLNPLGATYDEAVPDPYVGYDYQSVPGYHVPAGASTAVLYLVSPNPPVVGEAHVIDSGIGVVDVYVAEVPEPATLGLLAAGLTVLLARKRRRP
ncbi:MAG: PEP-CTERM sorting domain-containing protein [Planctomycetota bacterium]